MKTIFVCDSCGDSVHDASATNDWWAIGRFKDGAFISDKHICAKCHERIFQYKVASEPLRVN